MAQTWYSEKNLHLFSKRTKFSQCYQQYSGSSSWSSTNFFAHPVSKDEDDEDDDDEDDNDLDDEDDDDDDDEDGNCDIGDDDIDDNDDDDDNM